MSTPYYISIIDRENNLRCDPRSNSGVRRELRLTTFRLLEPSGGSDNFRMRYPKVQTFSNINSVACVDLQYCTQASCQFKPTPRIKAPIYSILLRDFMSLTNIQHTFLVDVAHFFGMNHLNLVVFTPTTHSHPPGLTMLGILHCQQVVILLYSMV